LEDFPVEAPVLFGAAKLETPICRLAIISHRVAMSEKALRFPR
jgi:hypothetical protein